MLAAGHRGRRCGARRRCRCPNSRCTAQILGDLVDFAHRIGRSGGGGGRRGRGRLLRLLRMLRLLGSRWSSDRRLAGVQIQRSPVAVLVQRLAAGAGANAFAALRHLIQSALVLVAGEYLCAATDHRRREVERIRHHGRTELEGLGEQRLQRRDQLRVLLQGGRRRLRRGGQQQRRGRSSVRIDGGRGVALGRRRRRRLRFSGGILLWMGSDSVRLCRVHVERATRKTYPVEVGQSLDAQRLGQRQQPGYLLLEHVHLARVHERQQGDHVAERGARQHDDRMEGRLQRAKQFGEERRAGAEDDAMGAHRAALGGQRDIGEQRLVEQQRQRRQEAGLSGANVRHGLAHGG